MIKTKPSNSNVVKGTTKNGDNFTMPSSDVVYADKTYSGATSITVILTYQTQSTSYDWVYLYDSTGKAYGKYGGTTRTVKKITLPGDSCKIVFHTNASTNNYYGFRALVVPNYD